MTASIIPVSYTKTTTKVTGFWDKKKVLLRNLLPASSG